MSKCYFKAKIRNSEIRSVKLVEHFMLMLMPTLCSATIKTDTNTHTFITLRHSLCTRVLKMKNINPKRTYRKRMLQFYKKKKTMHRWKKTAIARRKERKNTHHHRKKNSKKDVFAFGVSAKAKKEIYNWKYIPNLNLFWAQYNFYVQIWWLIKCIINAIYFRLKMPHAKWRNRKVLIFPFKTLYSAKRIKPSSKKI